MRVGGVGRGTGRRCGPSEVEPGREPTAARCHPVGCAAAEVVLVVIVRREIHVEGLVHRPLRGLRVRKLLDRQLRPIIGARLDEQAVAVPAQPLRAPERDMGIPVEIDEAEPSDELPERTQRRRKRLAERGLELHESPLAPGWRARLLERDAGGTIRRAYPPRSGGCAEARGDDAKPARTRTDRPASDWTVQSGRDRVKRPRKGCGSRREMGGTAVALPRSRRRGAAPSSERHNPFWSPLT